MTEYAADTDGAVCCVDCLNGACVRYGPCEAEACRCGCGRVAELDDRPADFSNTQEVDNKTPVRPA